MVEKGRELEAVVSHSSFYHWVLRSLTCGKKGPELGTEVLHTIKLIHISCPDSSPVVEGDGALS
jgi:hypothetical protein